MIRVIDTDTLGPLLFASAMALFAAHMLCGEGGRGVAKLTAAVSCVAYFAHAWNLKPVKDASRVTELICRSLVAAGFAFAASRFILTVLIALYAATLAKLSFHSEKHREPDVRPPEQKPEASVEVPMSPDAIAAEAHRRYEANVKRINESKLDDHQKESLLNEEKLDLERRLKDALE